MKIYQKKHEKRLKNIKTDTFCPKFIPKSNLKMGLKIGFTIIFLAS